MKTTLLKNILALAVCVGVQTKLHAQGTAFTYQGRLDDGGVSANGLYDFNCGLYRDQVDTNPIVTEVLLKSVPVTNGLFLLTLDFDPHAFTGYPLFLDLQVKSAGNSKFTQITPRQPITSTPYAARALTAVAAETAATADSAAVASAVVPGGVNATSLAVNAVGSSHLANNAVITVKINDGAVIASKLANDAVTTLKILDGAVTSQKIAAGAVGAMQLANGSVGSAQLAVNAVGTANMQAGAVTAAQLGAGAAAANLAADGQTAVPAGGIVLSASAVNTSNLVSAGYVKIGSVDLVKENWGTNGPALLSQNLPSVNPRVGHTAVWTGSEMIIWGGDEGYVQNTGSRYNPTANTWTPLNTSSSLVARRNHVAVWTGSQMLVWGGTAGYVTFYNDGARYNPATDAWSPMTMLNAPSPRENATAVWTGSKMVVWGGTTNNGYYDLGYGYAGYVIYDYNVQLPTGGRYDPAANTWSAISTAGAPPSTTKHSAVWNGTEMLVFGGSATNFSAGRYNPTSDTWGSITSSGAPSPRFNHSAVWTGTNMIIWGGTGLSPSNTYLALGNGSRYNPTANSWTGMSSVGAPSPRTQHTAVWTGNRMIIWGGKNFAEGNTNLLNNFTFDYAQQSTNSGAAYDPSANTWTATSSANAPVARDSHTAVWTGSDMLVWGGQLSSSTAGYNFWWGDYEVADDTSFLSAANGGARYNQSLNSWSSIPTVPLVANVAERQGATAVWSGTEMLVWGGENFGQLLRTGARFNPVANTWSSITTIGAPAARYKHTAVWDGSQMIVWGGTDSNYNTLATGGRYNPVTDSWKSISTSNAPAARASHVALWSGTEMLVWGGYQGGLLNPFPAAGGRYNPATDSWRPMNITNAPTSTAETAAAWSGAEMLVWGGVRRFISTSYYNSGGRYNPTTDSWVQFSTSNAPSARAQHVAAWTGSEYVLFGGQDAVTNLNTGGRYNPLTDTWRSTSLVNAPAPVTQHTGVWTGNELLVWGGFLNNGLLASATGAFYEPKSDTWRNAANPPYFQFSPIAFGNHCAVWTGRDMILWGGVSTNYNGTNYNATPYVYTPGRTMDLMLRP